MSNNLSKRKQINALQILCEGGSVRGTCRIVSIDKKTALRLLRRFGDAAIQFLKTRIRNLPLKHLEVDEMPGSVPIIVETC